jgi:protein-tyrosine phosphatase
MNMSELISDTASSENLNMFKLSDLYIGIIEKSKIAVRQVFSILAAADSKCTLFHCTAGKDRTGVVAALLLSLAGVPFEDILSNYEITNTHLRRVYGDIRYIAPEVPVSLIESNPVNMEIFLNYIEDNYGDTEKYLISIGLTESEIASVKNKFLDPAGEGD